jgi:transposase
MAPRLVASQHNMISDMIASKSLKTVDMAAAAGCSDRTIRSIRSNLRCFGSSRAPFNGGGRRRQITPIMLDALRERLLEKPGMYRDEMVLFLYDEFEITVNNSAVSRALASIGWTKKATRQIAKERNADLRDYYLHNLSVFQSHHLVYVDESGCDKRIGFRRTGWSPLGVAPVQIAQFHRDRRHQILPAYTQDGVLFYRVFQGSTDSVIFEDFIEQLLQHCGCWPEPKSVLVMDNASFHHSEGVKELCVRAGVKLVFLPPYSPDLNPIEEFFGDLKRFIRRNWVEYESNPAQDFGAFLEWCISVSGGRVGNARAHFRHAGVTIKASCV